MPLEPLHFPILKQVVPSTLLRNQPPVRNQLSHPHRRHPEDLSSLFRSDQAHFRERCKRHKHMNQLESRGHTPNTAHPRLPITPLTTKRASRLAWHISCLLPLRVSPPTPISAFQPSTFSVCSLAPSPPGLSFPMPPPRRAADRRPGRPGSDRSGPVACSLNSQPSTLNQFRVNLWSRSPVVSLIDHAGRPYFCFLLFAFCFVWLHCCWGCRVHPCSGPFALHRGALVRGPGQVVPSEDHSHWPPAVATPFGERAKSPKQIKTTLLQPRP
jgi:hypothetical protein